MRLFRFTTDSNQLINEAIEDFFGAPEGQYDPRFVLAKAEFFVTHAVKAKSNVFLMPEFTGILNYKFAAMPNVYVHALSRKDLTEEKVLNWNVPENDGITCLAYVSNWAAPTGSIFKTGKGISGIIAIERPPAFTETSEPIDYWS